MGVLIFIGVSAGNRGLCVIFARKIQCRYLWLQTFA
jgi:hypothetical protein